MFFGGIGGVVMFRPEGIRFDDREPPIVVSDIKVNYESIVHDRSVIPKGTLSSPEEIHLRYDQKTLSIDFTALDFRSLEKTAFAYRLIGFYDEWAYVSTQQRTAHYTHLPAGEYLFVVRSSTQKGVWNPKELHIRIVVHPALWERWWFRLLAAIALLGGIVFAVMYVSQRTLKAQLREVEMQEKIHAERERISRELHDSTGADLAGIISGLDVAERYLETSKVKTKRTIRSLTEEARLSMAQLRETIWALKTDSMTIHRFAETVHERALKQLQFEKKIAYHSTVRCDGGRVLTSMQIHNLMRIIQEGISNALRYSRVKNIYFSVTEADQYIVFMLVNDGKLKRIKENSIDGGNGIPNMERRAREINGTMTIDITREEGTKLTIAVPIEPSR
jgi:signal transduction histidine kinase